jgi:hypothetical protein
MGLLYVNTGDGRKKPSVFVWLALTGIILGGSVFLVTNKKETGLDGLRGRTAEDEARRAPSPVEKGETAKVQEEMDVEAFNAMQEQLAREREESGGYLSPEREKEITKKYETIAEERRRGNFQTSVGDRLGQMQQRTAEEEKPAPPPEPAPAKPEGYLTFAQRMEMQGATTSSGRPNTGLVFAPPTGGVAIPESTPDPDENLSEREQWERVTNLLPLGTFLRCVLDGDIVTNNLASHVWANVVIDETFRRQLQLPKGLVRLRGKTATEPVQNVVDVFFDTMLFSDGTELPINGTAYAAFDPRYPHRFRTRGIPGDLIVPPMWVKLQSLIYAAALGASDAYIQNYINENTSTATKFTTVPVIDPITGQATTQITEEQGNPVNNQIGATIALGAGQSALEELVVEVRKDAEKYKPYLIVEKGTPLFVQLNTTVNVARRTINGTAIAKAEELERNLQLAERGVPLPDTKEVYPPGDARAKYSGAGTPTETDQTAQAIQNAQQNLQQTRNALRNIEGSIGIGTQGMGTSGMRTTPGTGQPNVADLQQMLQQLQKK